MATKPASLDAEASKSLRDAEIALKGGKLELALIQFKNAVRLSPKNGYVRAQLGLALIRAGAPTTALRELRQAWLDNGPEEVVVPGILQALLVHGDTKELLEEFPDPREGSRNKADPDILRARAIALQALGRGSEAKTAMDRSLVLRRDAQSLITRAMLAEQQGDLPLSRNLADEATKLSPNNEDVFIFAIQLLGQSGEKQKALNTANEFIERVPQSVSAKAARIEVLLGLNKDADARREVDALLEQSPNLSLATYYSSLLRARAKDAKGAWHEAQSLQPEFVLLRTDIAISVARMALANGNLDSGGAILAALISRHPDVTEARMLLASVQLDQKSPDAALKTLDPLKASQNPQVQALLAQGYLRTGRYSDAILALQKATTSSGADNGNNLLKRQLALLQLENGAADKAIQELQPLATRDPGSPESAGPLIAALVRAEKFDEAMGVANRLSKGNEKNPLSAFYRGLILNAQGDAQGATNAFAQAIAADPKFVPALYYHAGMLLARGYPEAASKEFRQVLAQEPANIPAFLKLAQIAANKGQAPEAIALFNQAIKAAPDDPLPRLALGRYQLLSAKYQDAQTTVNALLLVSPHNPEGLALQGQIQFARGEKDRAIETFRSLTATSPYSPGTFLILAQALNAIHDRLAAIDAAKSAVELAPTSTQARGALIEMQIAADRPDDALQTARDYGTANPGPESDILLADTLLRLKRSKEAIAFLTERFSSKPSRALALRLSQIAVASDDTKKGRAVLTSWLQTHPDDYEARRAYASVLSDTGDAVGARREYETLLKQRPEDPVVLNNFALLLQQDDLPRALSLVAVAARVEPSSPDIIDTFGWMKYQHQDHKEALSLLQRAHDLDPADPSISYHLALALDASGKRIDAKTLLQSTLAKNPQFDEVVAARQLLARW